MLKSLIPIAALFSTVVATQLYVSSFLGSITVLDLQKKGSKFELTTLTVDRTAPRNTSFLLFDEERDVLYSTEEGKGVPNGFASSYKTSNGGPLQQISRVPNIIGDVHQAVYNGGKQLAVPHYAGSAITTYNIGSDGELSPSQTFTFNMTAPGPNPARQEAPHPHQAVVDPTGSYIVFPDLGADLIRVFSIDKTTGKLTELTPFNTPPGGGPRHGAFLVAQGKTYFFLLFELINTVKTYEVTGCGSGLQFTEVFSTGLFGNFPAPTEAAAAEAVISPDGNFLLTSSRLDKVFQLPDFDDPIKSIPSDSLQVWSIDKATGKLGLRQLTAAGGLVPRQFSLNKAGTLAAVGLQNDGRVVILERNADGTFGEFVAHIAVEEGTSSVVWNERDEK